MKCNLKTSFKKILEGPNTPTLVIESNNHSFRYHMCDI